VTFILIHSVSFCLHLPAAQHGPAAQESLHFVAVGSGKMVAQASACEEPVHLKPRPAAYALSTDWRKQVARALSLLPAQDSLDGLPCPV
jgi:hypothetical protein